MEAWKEAGKAFVVDRSWTLDIELTHVMVQEMQRAAYPAAFFRELRMGSAGLLKGVWVTLCTCSRRARDISLGSAGGVSKSLAEYMIKANYALSQHLGPSIADAGGVCVIGEDSNPAQTMAKLGTLFDADELTTNGWVFQPGDVLIGFCGAARKSTRVAIDYQWLVLRAGSVNTILSHLQSYPSSVQDEDCLALVRATTALVRYVYSDAS